MNELRRLLTIGELSRATSLTVKTLRHYHERGLLPPTHVDPDTGYRYYDASAVERARVIRALREFEFGLDEVAQILAECSDDADALRFLQDHRAQIAQRLSHLRSIARALDSVIETEAEAMKMSEDNYEIEDKQVPAQLVAGIRLHGAFEQCRDAFRRLGRAYGFSLAGKPGMLVYDDEYKADDSDFEPFFPVRKPKEAGDDIHRGPYDRSHVTYGRLFKEIRRRGLTPTTPSREIYIKGPGMFFRGNPEKYLTEIQVFVAPSGDDVDELG